MKSKLPVDEMTFETVADTELKNLRETLRAFPEEHKLLEELLKLYKTFISSLNSKAHDSDFPALQMFFICFREYLVSAQLTSQGHFSEAYTIISRASEAVGYGVVMKEDVEKAKLWVTTSGKKDFKALFGPPFPKGHKLLHPTIFHIYNSTRNYGSHANFGSTIHFISQIEPSKFEFVYSDINDIDWMKRNLLMVLHSFTEFIIVFKSLFGDYLHDDWKEEFEYYVTGWIKHRDANKVLFNKQ